MRYFYLIAGGVFFLSALTVNAPASLVGTLFKNDGKVLSWTHTRGSLWNGQIENLSMDGIYLGRATYRLAPLPLLRGSAKLNLTLVGGSVSGNGDVVASKNSLVIKDGKFRANLSSMTNRRAFGLPVNGVADINIAEIHFTRKGCRTADVTVWTDFLSSTARQVNAEGFALEGPARCEGEDLLVSLEGAGNEGNVQLHFKLRVDMTYDMVALVEPKRRVVADALVFLGFKQSGTALNYEVAGTLQEAGL